MLQKPKVIVATAAIKGSSLPSYSYALKNPIKNTDEDGLYGTKCCSTYRKKCTDKNGWYYCELAKSVCGNTQNHDKPPNWSDCCGSACRRTMTGCADQLNRTTRAALQVRTATVGRSVGLLRIAISLPEIHSPTMTRASTYERPDMGFGLGPSGSLDLVRSNGRA
jgi:hypothetical protein